ncbi:MAG: DUF1659 domain-containing protein [Sarcina sp.]
MAIQNIVKSSLVLKYQFGMDSHGNPKLTAQKFSSVKPDSDAASYLSVGNALADLVSTSEITVNREDFCSLRENQE